jgi:hypothetical protein
MKNTIGHNRWEISRTESPGNHSARKKMLGLWTSNKGPVGRTTL